MMVLFLLWLCMMLLIIWAGKFTFLQRCESSDSDNGNYDDNMQMTVMMKMP